MVTVGAAVAGAVDVVVIVLLLLLPLPPHATRLAKSGRSAAAAAQRSLSMGIVRSRGNTRFIGTRLSSLSVVVQVTGSRTVRHGAGSQCLTG
jgi:hypothetical protein